MSLRASSSVCKLLLGVGVSLLCSLSLTAQSRMTVRSEEHHDVSPALRDLIQGAPKQAQAMVVQEAEPVRRIPLPTGLTTLAEDPVRQRTAAFIAAFAPAVGLGFEGLGNAQYGFSVTGAPPDTNGAVGATQYVQWVNISFAIFNKSTGALISGPTLGNTLWSGFGGGCQTNNDGDPIVLYDKLANRWIFSQFSVSTTPYLQCIAVSTTSDATGTYNRYSFQYNNFDDYPKMGVWPDGYYETFNMFNGNTFVGADACAYNRTAMLNGTSATQICFQQNSSVGGLLPADLDGTTAPPAGSSNYMLYYGTNNLNLFKFHVDFTTPSNSTFTGPTTISVAAFTPLCNGGTCVPQPGTANQLDSLADRLMHRLAYRNFGTHESLVVNHSVVAGGGGGVRWYEIQNPSGTPVLAQQGTFAPDSSYRWMGSMAMDKVGDLAVGYSVSNGSSVFPSIAFTGRIPTDPSGTLQAETRLISGSGSQTGTLTRWGDYSAMQVDPVDDCTFWYTNEYIKSNGTFNWNTRIASFKFPNCVTFPLTVTLGGIGGGTVTSSPSGINCPGTCSANFVSGTTVTLTATPAAGSSFAGWSGACSGTGTCSVSMTAARNVTGTFSVTTSTKLTASSAQANAGSSVTFSAKVAPASGTTTPTGTVIFTNGQTVLGTAQLSNGTASLTTTSLAAGSYSVAASYGGDTNFSGSSSNLVALMVVDFTITLSQSSLTVTRGQSAQTTLMVTPAPLASFNPNVTFACSGLPLESTCNFSPSSLTPNGAAATTTLTIQTTAPTARLQRLLGRTELFYALLLPGLVGIVFAKGNGRRMLGRMRVLGMVGILMLSTVWWTACGAGAGSGTSSGSNSGTSPNSGTPTGSSTVTITATSSAISKQVTITLTVQ
jgi:hypothetical protein